MKKSSSDNLLALIFILVGAGLRFIPHAPNFTPIAALALFGGSYLNKRYAILIPLLALLFSDYLIGFYNYKLMLAVYGSFALVGLLGLWLREHKKFQYIIGASLLSSIIFYLVSNFAVWAFTPWYEKTLFGLERCYLLALPFFKNTLTGDLFYVSCMFGVYELATFWGFDKKILKWYNLK